MLEHGGQIRQAALRFGIPPEDWLDLSTGINPLGWPVPAIPPECWRRLPDSDDGLMEAVCRYYGCRSALAVAGSQAAIQALPSLRPPCRVGLLAPTYAEHALAWTRGGHHVVSFASAEIEARLDRLDVLVLVNPNNPTGERFPVETLRAWHRRLTARGGWLVVDEAFMDATPEESLAAHAGAEGLVVLRSLGKFFGLAGARVGFVLAWPELLVRLNETLGPWPVAHPARHVARLALADETWQVDERRRLVGDSMRLDELLGGHGLSPAGGIALFQWVKCERALAIRDELAQTGILVRCFDSPLGLRFGLPGGEAEWVRLGQALRGVS
ncbi:threonine-phosphate decarboxylase CobD [Falsiroseomonas sp.]|uniref:threonine-phosphate decarboxylase CobD n=1 Tax=Falsiroseomonas sp. TaxID=2870721 RepID=UPI002733F30B|nr:threonine-phosphate decarboxylase CobD [Falsiroseomonas sp.]MDP3416169.1 threonine-phosphate decarboxylase CobD [Falsiroseomonas sp.]